MRFPRFTQHLIIYFYCTVLVGVLAGPGCAIRNLLKEPALTGDPGKTGILIFGWEVRTNFQDRGLLSMATDTDNRAYPTGGVVHDGQGNERAGVSAWSPFTSANVVVFADLAPGYYTLRSLRGKYMLDTDAREAIYRCTGDGTVNKTCPTVIEVNYQPARELSERFTFEIRTGQVAFGGTITFDEPHDPPFESYRNQSGDTFDVHVHEFDNEFLIRINNERDVLKAVASEFKGGPWTKVVRKRIQELDKDGS